MTDTEEKKPSRTNWPRLTRFLIGMVVFMTLDAIFGKQVDPSMGMLGGLFAAYVLEPT